MNTLLWYWEITWDYIYEMLPCMALADVGFFLLRPTRRRRLERLNLASGVWREGALLARRRTGCSDCVSVGVLGRADARLSASGELVRLAWLRHVPSGHHPDGAVGGQ